MIKPYLFPLLLTFAASGQTPDMQHDMPGMNHGSPAAEQQPSTPSTSVPDLLREQTGRTPLRLSDLEQQALTQNPTLKQANSLVKQSEAQAHQAGLYPNPSAGYQGEQIRGGSYGGGEQGGFVQQTFVLGGKLGLRRAIFNQQKRSDEFGVSEQRFRILSDVDSSFYSALAAQQIVDLRQKLLGLASDAVTTARQLANVGQADAPDVLQAEVEEEQAKVDYTTAQRHYIQAFRSLAALSGNPELPLSPLAGTLEHAPQLEEKTLLEQIITDSPSVKRAQQEVARSEAEWKSARREAIPDLQVRAGVQQNSEPLNPIGTPVGLQGFASAGVTLPIFNRNTGNVAAAAASIERSRDEVRRVQLSLRQDAQPVLQEYFASQAQAERYRTQMIPRAGRAYQLYLDRYRSMAAAYPQVLVSQRTYFQLQVAYITTVQSVWTNAVLLQNYLLGSGLMAPMSSGSLSTTVNLPSGEGSSLQ